MRVCIKGSAVSKRNTCDCVLGGENLNSTDGGAYDILIVHIDFTSLKYKLPKKRFDFYKKYAIMKIIKLRKGGCGWNWQL